MRVAFNLTGEMPLIMHADDIDAADALMKWRKNPANKNVTVRGDDRSPAWTWQAYIYSDGEHVTMPSQNIMVALRQAGAQMIMKKQKTFKELSQSGMVITNEYCDLFVGDKKISIDSFAWQSAAAGDDDDGFEAQVKKAAGVGIRLFTKRAKVGTSKHIRVRPRFDSWRVSGEINVVAPELTVDIITQLFDLAGRVGLCDWRPGCKTPGPYGMFSAKVKKVA
jgi:hypothetical protein